MGAFDAALLLPGAQKESFLDRFTQTSAAIATHPMYFSGHTQNDHGS